MANHWIHQSEQHFPPQPFVSVYMLHASAAATATITFRFAASSCALSLSLSLLHPWLCVHINSIQLATHNNNNFSCNSHSVKHFAARSLLTTLSMFVTLPLSPISVVVVAQLEALLPQPQSYGPRAHRSRRGPSLSYCSSFSSSTSCSSSQSLTATMLPVKWCIIIGSESALCWVLSWGRREGSPAHYGTIRYSAAGWDVGQHSDGPTAMPSVG